MDRQVKPEDLQMLRASEVAKILGYKDADQARRIMREEMMHLEDPVRVPVSVLQTWINEHMYMPAREIRKETKGESKRDRIPRRRGGKLQGVSA